MGPDVEEYGQRVVGQVFKTAREKKLEEHIEKLRNGYVLLMESLRSEINDVSIADTVWVVGEEYWTMLDYCEHMSLMSIDD